MSEPVSRAKPITRKDVASKAALVRARVELDRAIAELTEARADDRILRRRCAEWAADLNLIRRQIDNAVKWI